MECEHKKITNSKFRVSLLLSVHCSCIVLYLETQNKKIKKKKQVQVISYLSDTSHFSLSFFHLNFCGSVGFQNFALVELFCFSKLKNNKTINSYY